MREPIGPGGRSLEASLSSLDAHDHICLLYGSEAERRQAILPFITVGLARNERCFYVADSRTCSDVGAALREVGVDVDAFAARGALAIATEREAYLARGCFDPEGMVEMAAGAAAQAVRDGYRLLRIAGEMTWALGGDPGVERIMEYEVKVNERIPSTPCLALCQYDRRRFSPEVLRDVVRTHPLVVVGGRVCRNFYYVPPGEMVGPDRLLREVDRLLENIVERELAEEALRESERRLAVAGRLASMGTLAASVAHEINNPLAYVTGNMQWVEESLATVPPGELERVRAEVRKAVAEAIDGAGRIRHVVQGLRRFAGPVADAPRQPVDVVEELDAAIAIARHQVTARARLHREVARSLPAVMLRPNELGQVVVNLIVNAAQAIPEGRSTENEVRVGARRVGTDVVIEVSDTGSGIPPDVLPRIFDPFFTTKTRQSGTGLGLAICQGIVAGAGGRIDVESRPGLGTTFRVFLPATGWDRAVPRAPAGPEAEGRKRVLLVDDEPLMGRTLARLLGPAHDVEILLAAREAAERAEAGERWDLVLCDLMMPDMSGAELAARLATSAPDALRAFVFMTGGAFTEGTRAFLADGRYRCVEKPIDPATLRALLAEAGGEPRAP